LVEHAATIAVTLAVAAYYRLAQATAGCAWYQKHNAIDKTAYMDAWKKHIKLHVQVFLRMNTWMFETCRRHY